MFDFRAAWVHDPAPEKNDLVTPLDKLTLCVTHE
jgi:hypothetical protein